MNSLNMWSTPILRAKEALPPDQLEELVRVVLREDAHQRGTKIGTFNASKTESDLLRLGDPALFALRDAVAVMEVEMLRSLGIDADPKRQSTLAEAWGVVYHDWGFHRVHSHHDSAWSGVLYLDMGDSSADAGRIEFVDPRPAAGARNAETPTVHHLKPTSGEMILFPSWLEHWVTPHEGTRPRVVIAFNLGYEAQ